MRAKPIKVQSRLVITSRLHYLLLKPTPHYADLLLVKTYPTSHNFIFKGTVSRDFLLLVFFMNQFPPAPEYLIRTFQILFENSGRYLQVKVQIFPPVLLVLLIPVANLPLVSMIPAENCHRCQRYRQQNCHQCQQCRWQIAIGINKTGANLPPVLTTPVANSWNIYQTADNLK